MERFEMNDLMVRIAPTSRRERCEGASAELDCEGASAEAECEGASADALCEGASAEADCEGNSAEARLAWDAEPRSAQQELDLLAGQLAQRMAE